MNVTGVEKERFLRKSAGSTRIPASECLSSFELQRRSIINAQ